MEFTGNMFILLLKHCSTKLLTKINISNSNVEEDARAMRDYEVSKSLILMDIILSKDLPVKKSAY